MKNLEFMSAKYQLSYLVDGDDKDKNLRLSIAHVKKEATGQQIYDVSEALSTLINGQVSMAHVIGTQAVNLFDIADKADNTAE